MVPGVFYYNEYIHTFVIGKYKKRNGKYTIYNT